MVDWLNETAIDGQEFTLAGDTIALTGLQLDGDGNGFLSWDFGLFNREHAGSTPMQVTGVPEPSTYLLLLVGAVGIWFLRRKRQ